MQLLHLYYFKLLAENEHLLNTAKAIHISPPALSSTISKLENELNVELFDRVGRKIKLNENGKILYIHVCNIFSELDSIKHELSKTPSPRQNTIQLGVSAQSLWVKAISKFMSEHPGIIIRHSALRTAEMQDPQMLDKYDLVITDLNDIDNKSWEHQFIIEDPPVLLVNRDHPYANLEWISLFDVRDEGFVALTSGFSSRDWFENSCKQAGFIPHIVAESDYILRSQLIENGYGIGFSSVLGYRAMSNAPAIKMVRVKYPPNPRMQTVFWKTGVSQSKAVTQFRDYLIDFYKNVDITG